MGDIDVPRDFEILLIEDNPGDVLLIKECLRRLLVRTSLVVARDGAEAMKILRNMEGDEGSTRPDLVLLDLHLPRVGGLELLRWIRSTSELSALHVLVLTCSDSRAEACECRDLGVVGFMPKAAELGELRRVARTIEAHLMSSR